VSPGNIRANVTVEPHWAQNAPPPARFRDLYAPAALPFESIFERIMRRSKGAARTQAPGQRLTPRNQVGAGFCAKMF
jgi:hypothetical protein